MTTGSPGVGPRSRGRRVRLVADLTALGGLVAILSAVPGARRAVEPLEDPVLPVGVQVGGTVAAVLSGLVLLWLSGQLRRRKRAAWVVALVVFGVTAVAHLLRGPDLVTLVVPVLLVVLLVSARGQFDARPDPPSLWALGRAVPMFLGVVFGRGTVALLLEHGEVQPPLSIGGVLGTVVLGVVGMSGPYTYDDPFFARAYPASLLALGLAGAVGLAWFVFRPVAAAHHREPGEWQRAAALVRRYGWDTLSPFALRRDKSFFFSSDGEAMLAYAYLGGHALVSGDPIGAAPSVGLLIDEFLAFCHERGWLAAFLAVREVDVARYEQRGLASAYLGDEALVHCDRFDVAGKKMKSVRQATNRVARTYRFELLREVDAPRSLVRALNDISHRWRQKAPERGFTMSLSQEVTGEEPGLLLCVAVDERGRPGGFLRIVPTGGEPPGYTLDLMRHDPGTPNGMTDFLVVNTAMALAERGVTRLSLNFAAWGRLFDRAAPLTWPQRIARRVVSLLNPFFQVRSLRAFNAKFQPEWIPRSVVAEDISNLPWVAVLYAGAEGFLSLPGIGPLLVPRVLAPAPAPPGAGEARS